LNLKKNYHSSNPQISIITVVLNAETTIQRTIESVINQKSTDVEYIIIDGGSNDNTIEIVNKFSKEIDLIISEKDSGIYDAFNKGLKLSRGKIVGFLNAGDIYYPNAINLVKKYFNNNPNLDFLFGTVIKHKILSGYNSWMARFSFGGWTTHSAGFFIKKESHLKAGLYNCDYKYCADYDLFLKIILKRKMLGMGTLKKEVFGECLKGGFSARINFIDKLSEMSKIRICLGQNKLLVLVIFILRYLKNINIIVKPKYINK